MVISTFFSVISPRDIVGIKRLNVILPISGQCDVERIMMLSINTISSVVKVLTYIFISIKVHPIGLTTILAIMSVSSFTTDDILYVLR